MKSLLFLVLLFVIASIAWKVHQVKDGFQDITPPGASPGLNSPVISPRGQTLTSGEVKPFAEPNTALLAPPPGQTSSVNSLPAEDPALQKTDARRLYSVYESLIGFFKNEAKGLLSMGDSTIQLPMSTAKSDVARLRDELGAIDRNPGMQSSLTQDDVNGIEQNLGYLQAKWRLSANLMGAPSPMPPASEGFTTRGGGWFTYFFGGNYEGFQAGSGSGSGPGSTPTGSTPTGSGPTSTGSGPSASNCGSSCPATLEQLTGVSTSIVAEIVRLQASGATDSTTQNRIKLLTTILQTVNDMTTGLKNGTIKATDITITTRQVNRFLTNIQNPNSPLTNILSDWGLPSGLSNLFPTYAAGDVSGADLAKDLFGKYVKNIENLSWDISLNYKGKAEQEIAANYASAMNDARYFSDTVGTPTASNASPTDKNTASAYGGLFQNVISSVSGQTATVEAGMGGLTPNSGSRPVTSSVTSPFDWKARSKQICSQIKMRQMDPYEFGCLNDPEKVRQDNFSWRGYTKMICSRLATVYDPSIPELCGCPPPAWIGWKP